MTNRTRAERIHHRNRIKSKVTHYKVLLHSEVDEKTIGIFLKTKKPCSCWMCGNKRKIEGDTIQERKVKIAYDEGWNGISSNNLLQFSD